MRTVATCLSAALLLAANGAAAQVQAEAPAQVPVRAQTTEYRGGLNLMTSAIDPIAADSAGVGHRAYGLQIAGSLVTYRVLSLNAEGGMVMMTDEAAFTENTTQGEKTSGVAAVIGSVSAGLHTPPISLGGSSPSTLSAGVNAGQTFLHVSRTISNCNDCRRESVNIGAGSFWEPVVTVGLPRGAVYARYRTYLGGSDFNDALTIGYSVGRERSAPAAEAPPELPADPPASTTP